LSPFLAEVFNPFQVVPLSLGSGYFFFTPVTGPRRSSSHTLSDPEMCSGSEAGSYVRLIDSCITRQQLPREWQELGGWTSSHPLAPRSDSRRCSRDTYSESYITKYTSIRRLPREWQGLGRWTSSRPLVPRFELKPAIFMGKRDRFRRVSWFKFYNNAD